MTPTSGSKSGLYDEEPKRQLKEFQYLFEFLSENPSSSHEGGVFALLFPNGHKQFIYHHHNRPYLVGHMNDLARFLNAKLIVVPGVWTWTSTEESKEE